MIYIALWLTWAFSKSNNPNTMTAATNSLANLDPAVLTAALLKDRQFRAFCPKTVTVTFGVRVNGDAEALVLDVQEGAPKPVRRGITEKADFVLAADAGIWAKFFAEKQELGCVFRAVLWACL